MAFDYLTNTPLDEARKEYLALLAERGFTHKSETVSVADSCSRITSEPVYAHICAPHYNASAMDGVALKASLTFGASETTPVTLSADSYTVVDTGDPLPDGCDAVVMIEDVVKGEDGAIRLYAAAAPWQHIRQIGEDICAGEMILPSFSKITPASIGSMTAGGVLQVNVICKPVIGIIPTGDEIVPPTENPKPGDILEFNSSIFSAMLGGWGAKPKTYPICRDEFDLIKSAVKKASDECDIVILNAGSSAGREDYSCQAIMALGEVKYHGIAIKPGKPAILGLCNSKPVLGVPGYPVSGIIVIEELLKPIIDYWFHTAEVTGEYVEAVLSRAVVSGLKYREYVRVSVGNIAGKYVCTPLNRGAGVVSSFMKADGILEVPQRVEGFEVGQAVSVKLMKPLSRINNTLVAIGSHDPLLDELADMLHRADNTLYMSSTHVGSMGGIMAVKRGETHIAGTHLLNESDGQYNTAYIEKYFPSGGVRLVECVGRTQGLMLKSGNPLGIRSFEDLTLPDLRFVNRQKGSGTRVLTDYLLKKYGIDSQSVYGYDREEFTHTSVAAQVASGSADAGMGIFSAAKLYGLEFLPVCTEQYDLLVEDSVWDTPLLKMLIEVLKSEEFAARLEQMGGYSLKNPGKVRQVF